jgi:hypothetical protein
MYEQMTEDACQGAHSTTTKKVIPGQTSCSSLVLVRAGLMSVCCLSPHLPELYIWFMSLQPQHIECVQALQQLGVISQVPGVSAVVINNTTQQSMDTRGH